MQYSDEQLEHWLTQGFTVAEVSRRTGIGYWSLYNRARRRGWNTSAHKPRAVTPDRYDRLRELFAAGKTGPEIGIEMGIGHECAYDMLDWLGLKREPLRNDLERMADLYGQGLLQKEIAAELGTYQGNVSVALGRAGVHCHRPVVVDVDGIVRLFHEGKTGARIARTLAISIDSVYRHLRHRGLTLTRGWDKADWREAVRLYQEGYNCPQVGERIGVDRNTVRRYLKRAGVERRQGRGGQRKD